MDPGCLSRILIFTHSGSRIWDPRSKTTQKRVVKNISCHTFFLLPSLLLLFLDPGSQIRDPEWVKIRIQDKHPGSATLQVTRHCVHPARPGADWLLSIDQLGDVSVSGLNWSHEACNSLPLPVESTIRLRCTAGQEDCQRRPDRLGETRVLASWRDTVQRARGAGSTWLEASVERR